MKDSSFDQFPAPTVLKATVKVDHVNYPNFFLVLISWHRTEKSSWKKEEKKTSPLQYPVFLFYFLGTPL